MVKRLSILFLMVAISSLVQAQSVRFFTNAEKITTEDALVVSVEVQGARQLSTPKFPRVPGFRQVGTSTNQSYINGAAKVTFSASYYPNQPGSYKVPAFRYNVGGKDYDSKEFPIQVVRGDAAKKKIQKKQQDLFQQFFGSPFDDFFNDPAAGSQRKQPKKEDFKETTADYFLAVNMDKDSCYIGEQVFAEVALYINVFDRNKIVIDGDAIREFNNRMKNPDFWQEVFDLSQIPAETVNINGKTYIKYTFYRSILFPLITGDIQFKDMFIDGKKLYVAATGSPFDAFFPSNQKYEPIKIKARTRTIKVKPLPDTPLPNANMVGKFKMEAQLSDSILNTGEILELKVRIKGNGNMAMMHEPSAEIPDAFETDDPVSEYNIFKTEDAQYGEKDFTWSVVPTKSGNYTLGPIKFYYFNTSTSDYDSLVVDGMSVRIEGDDLSNIVLKSSGIDMFYSKGIDESSDTFRNNHFRGKWGIVLILAAVLGTAVYGGMRVLRSRVKDAPTEVETDVEAFFKE